MKKEELIWVSKEFAAKYNQIDSEDRKLEELQNYISGLKREVSSEFEAMLSSLDEDVIIFQGLVLKAKQSFTKAKDEALSSSYALWQEYEKERPSVSAKIKELTDTVNPFLEKLDQVNTAMSRMQTYNIEKVLDVINKFESMSDRGKAMFEFMMLHHKEI